jgi:signal transduction histidine kinase
VKPIPLVSVLEDELSRVRDVHPEADVRVEGSLPAAEVAANEMLASVFRNSLINAVTHTDTETPTVTVEATATEATVRVTVTDEGPGLPSDRGASLADPDRSVIQVNGVGVGHHRRPPACEPRGRGRELSSGAELNS